MIKTNIQQNIYAIGCEPLYLKGVSFELDAAHELSVLSLCITT